MLGYWERPEATAEALAGGELHTGDLGFLDADGYLHLRDRKSLVIIRGGANVYPAEVERVLLEAPGVAAGAVLGVPDERLGERVVAVVEPAPARPSTRTPCARTAWPTSPSTRCPSASWWSSTAPQRHGQDRPHGAARPALTAQLSSACIPAAMAASVAFSSSAGLNMTNSVPALAAGVWPGDM